MNRYETEDYQRRLDAKVKATNRCHAAALALYDQLVPIFTPWVGKKILTVDGTLLAKVKSTIPELPNKHDYSVHRYSQSNYSLAYTVKTSECCDPEHSVWLYAETTLYIGTMEGPVLTKITTPRPIYRTDYTSAEITQYRKEYDAAKNLADAAHSKLYNFGETDR